MYDIDMLEGALRHRDKRIRELEDERDALAAHVERLERAGGHLARELREWMGLHGRDDESERAVELWEEAKARKATTSLARLIAEKQAEALEEASDRAPPDVALWLKALARDYRRQAEGGE